MKPFNWMQRAKSSVNRKGEFRKLGSMDIRVGFSAGSSHRVIDFGPFAVGPIHDVEDISEIENVSVVVRMTPRRWDDYLRNRKTGKEGDLIAFNLGKQVLYFNNPLDRLRFLRVHRSIQAFVDAGARLARPS